jgi:hypothetical protein
MPGEANEAGRLSLSGLLSQVLVAFTIECDNEFERRMPHRTSSYGSTAGRGTPGWCRWRCGGPACGSLARTAAGPPTAAR